MKPIVKTGPNGLSNQDGSVLRIFLYVFAALFLLVIFAVGWVVWGPYHQPKGYSSPVVKAARLEDKARLIRAQGDPADSTELNAWYKTPSGQNSAMAYGQYLEVVRGMPSPMKGSPVPFLGRGDMPVPGESMSRNMSDAIEEYLADYSDILNELMALEPVIARGRYPADLSRGFEAQLPHIGGLRKLHQVLCLRALATGEKGLNADSTRALLHAAALSESIASEPIMVSQLQRASSGAVMLSTLEFLLNQEAAHGQDKEHEQGKWLGILAAKLPGLESHDDVLARVLVGERAALLGVANLPPERVAQLFGNGDFNDGQSTGIYARSKMIRKDIRFLIDAYDQYVNLARQGFPAATVLIPLMDERSEEARKNRYFLAAQTLVKGPIVGKLITDVAQTRLIQAALATERYRLDHSGRPPEKLEALVPNYLAKSPLDPFTGKVLAYYRSDDNYSIEYSGKLFRDHGRTRTSIQIRYSAPVKAR